MIIEVKRMNHTYIQILYVERERERYLSTFVRT